MVYRVLLLLCIIPLAGCGSGASTPTPVPVSLSGNWQIQSGSAITPVNAGGVFLTGSLQFQSPQVTGTMTVTAPCITQPIQNLTGLIDSSGNLNLTASPIPDAEALLVIPSNASQLATGTVSSAGEICNIAFSGPGVGIQITALSGTYAGAVTSGSTTGNVSLALTQSSTPNVSGQFPLTGTLTYSATGCNEPLAVSGTISGTTITLASATTPVSGQNYVSLAASTNQTATQITASAIQFQPAPCSTSASSTATYTGSLTQ